VTRSLSGGYGSFGGMTTPEPTDARWLVDKFLNGTPAERADPHTAERLRHYLAQHDGGRERALLDMITEAVEEGRLDVGDFRPRVDEMFAKVRDALYHDPSTDVAAATLAEFEAAVAAGEPCARLFEVRNAMDPKSQDKVRANELLRDLGCWSASSTRTQQE